MTADTIHEIALGELTESPFNPRKIFNERALNELATDIKSQGRVLQPLLVRPIVPPLFAGHADATTGYEVVFGHRRLRAAEAAGLASVPCMVRAMTDDEARRAQISENLQREDVHAIEEAEGFQALIDGGTHTADSIAAEFGKSRSHVYGRLKLLQACPEIRKACLADEIGSEVALLIARLRTDKLQEKALAAIRGDTSQAASLTDGGARSYRHIREMLAEKFTLDLKTAIFDVEDEVLLPLAGNCTNCPKRSANAPEFADLAEPRRPGEHRGYTVTGGPDICTDPDCYAAKKTAHLKREAAKLEAKGKKVVVGNAARQALSAHGEVKGAYIALKNVKAEMQKLGAKKTVAYGDPTPKSVLIQDPRTGKTVEAVKRDDLKAAGVKVAEPSNGHAANYAAQEARRKAEQAKNEAAAELEQQVRLAALSDIRDAITASERTAFDLQLVARAAWAGVEYRGKNLLAKLWGFNSEGALDQRIGQMDLPSLTLFALDCALIGDCRVSSYSLKDKPTTLMLAAKHYGVDVAHVRAEITARASTPTSAAQAHEGATTAPAKAKPKKAKAPATAKRPAAKYVDPITLQTWSGRGLQPAWIKAALRGGKKLDDFLAKSQEKQKDDAGVAGGSGAQADLLEAAEV